MADAQSTKLKYKRGTCFGCRKCLYCGVNLQEQKCGCKITKPPSRNNRTSAVKYAYTRVFNPDWSKEQISFIQEKVSMYNYSVTLKRHFNLSLCSRCNSTLLRLTSAKPKNLKPTPNSEVYDLTITEKQDSLGTSEFDENSDSEDAYSANDDIEYELQYGVFIKLDGKFQPAKWYKVTVSEIDEFLAEIHTNVVALTQNESIEACDYHVTFKSEKSNGAGTQLADAQDFQKFYSEYCKFSTKNINMGIFITINSKDLSKKKRKQEDLDSRSESEVLENNSIGVHKNKNRVPKSSSLTSKETQMAKNVLEIRTSNHCDIHNRACLNRNNSKENHIEITFMMLSTWASEMNKGLATSIEPPTHPLFAHQRPTKTKSSYL